MKKCWEDGIHYPQKSSPKSLVERGQSRVIEGISYASIWFLCLKLEVTEEEKQKNKKEKYISSERSEMS